MNLFLTRDCDQGCAFCYALAWMGGDSRDDASLERLWPALEHYARLVRGAGAPPLWQAGAGPAELLASSAGTVNLLGGEPTAHPAFAEVVRRLRSLRLGVNLFTSGAHPERVRSVADSLWFVTLNGRFVERAPLLGVELTRMAAHLPLRPGDDVVALLEAVARAGLRSAVLAFAAPAGGAAGPFFAPPDLAAMAAVVQAAEAAGARLGLTLGWDCAPPRCVLPDGPGRCLPVPVLDCRGMVSVCGGAYLLEARLRPIQDFDSIAALHTWVQEVYSELSQRPSPYEACQACPQLDEACMGMCLGWREVDHG